MLTYPILALGADHTCHKGWPSFVHVPTVSRLFEPWTLDSMIFRKERSGVALNTGPHSKDKSQRINSKHEFDSSFSSSSSSLLLLLLLF